VQYREAREGCLDPALKAGRRAWETWKPSPENVKSRSRKGYVRFCVERAVQTYLKRHPVKAHLGLLHVVGVQLMDLPGSERLTVKGAEVAAYLLCGLRREHLTLLWNEANKAELKGDYLDAETLYHRIRLDVQTMRMTYEEIGKRVGISQSAVTARMKRNREVLGVESDEALRALAVHGLEARRTKCLNALGFVEAAATWDRIVGDPISLAEWNQSGATAEGDSALDQEP